MRCRICGFERGFAPHLLTAGECESVMRERYASSCASPGEHHRFRADWLRWLRDLGRLLHEAVR